MRPSTQEDLEKDWRTLLEGACLDDRPPDRLGMTGIWAEEDGWHFRPPDGLEVRVPVLGAFERLRTDLVRTVIVGRHEADRAIVLGVAEAKISGQTPGWSSARSEITSRLNSGVATVALGGIISSEVDADGFAAPLGLGENTIAGHLDPSIDQAAADLARRHGLPGYRFGDDSWWTEDFLSAKEDLGAGAEQMEEMTEAESWPWLAVLVAVPASGAASEVAAVAAAQALLGALVLLDQPPGAGWGGAVPWIAGGLGPAGDPRWPGDESYDWLLPIAPQHVDAMTRRLDNAESEFGTAPARVIDLAAHAKGPARELIVAVLDSSLVGEGENEKLARACRLAWLGSATETASTRWTLARSACCELLCSAGSHYSDLVALATDGASWRRENDRAWPTGNPYTPDGDLEAWEEGLVDSAGVAELPSPSWGEKAAIRAGAALDLMQACFFGVAGVEKAEH